MTIGHSFTPRLVTKLVLVAALFVLGPVIDNVVELNAVVIFWVAF